MRAHTRSALVAVCLLIATPDRAHARPGPPVPTEQRTECARPASAPLSLDVPRIQQELRFADVWPLTRGGGQTVAVIDTGVTPHPLLPRLIAGGDFVSTGDGLSDCDAHGTVVAGLIASASTPDSGFTGGAPDATILSIRQSSGAFAEAESAAEDATEDADTSSGYGDVNTLAAAVRLAADSGASVINVSEVACARAGVSLGDDALESAVRYAAVERDVVVVAAAGNLDGRRCRDQNAIGYGDASRASSASGTVASPARFDDVVLTVGSLDDDGRPSSFSVAGPWVDIAAPGTGVTSISPSGAGLSSGVVDAEGRVSAYAGTSFAAPLVSATAALVRSRFPDLSAAEVIDRIERTAHSPAGGWNSAVGYGGVDPVAAVTSTATERATATAPLALAARPAAAAVDRGPGLFALAASGALAAITALLIPGAAVVRRRAELRMRPVHRAPGSTTRPS